ncbi:hypothetical protein F8M41_020266 [Gigaspora margarita]|uniref:Uncharacterized protein n=1 Tax=Gigaspora margarita TaxID=4874 RepID=A0A8H4EU25_GIGMA|nr:hypothetical protein F8M41_020266 [Gigaspora margarita]
MINQVKLENYLLLDINMVLFEAIENSKFALHRKILADEFLDDILHAKLIAQFEETIIPICLHVEPEQPEPKQSEP